jgi:hypothetical protein
MFALEVKLNGKRICIAGADDLGVLHANIAAVGKLGAKTVPLRDDETATSRINPKKDMSLNWKSIAPLRIGDVIEVKVIEAKNADRPSSRKNADRARAKRSR